MQQREKILAGALSGVLVLWLGLPIFERTFLEPLSELEQELSLVEGQHEQRRAARLELARADVRLKDWRAQSLPPDPLDAQRLYQEWLTNLALLSGFDELKVTLERRVRGGETFVTVPVTLEGLATTRELTMFLDRFREVSLLHRITRCHVTSPSSSGDPELQVVITAEGVSVLSAPSRSRLFPETTLAQKVGPNDALVRFEEPLLTAETLPARLQIEQEFLDVVEVVEGGYRVERGAAGSLAEAHEPGSRVAWIQLRDVDPETTSEKGEALWVDSPFVKPAPPMEYNPRLASTTPPAAVRGKEWKWELKVASWDPSDGNAVYRVSGLPEGMTLNARTGELSWTPGDEVPAGSHPIEVEVDGSLADAPRIKTNLDIVLREPNHPPSFADVSELTFYLGRESRVQLTASDEDLPQQSLRFQLSGDVPEGMEINERTGELSWTPPESLELTTMTVSVSVTDSGVPPESTKVDVPVRLAEDSARFTYLTACLARATGTEAWLFDRATNRKRVVKEGDRVEIADKSFRVVTIAADSILCESATGFERLMLGESVLEMTPVAAPPGLSPGRDEADDSNESDES